MIHLYENWYLDADDKNYILTEWDGKTNKNGNRVVMGVHYITSLSDVFRFLGTIETRRKVKACTTMKELEAEVKAICGKLARVYAEAEERFEF